jgi:hypothetical protein
MQAQWNNLINDFQMQIPSTLHVALPICTYHITALSPRVQSSKHSPSYPHTLRKQCDPPTETPRPKNSTSIPHSKHNNQTFTTQRIETTKKDTQVERSLTSKKKCDLYKQRTHTIKKDRLTSKPFSSIKCGDSISKIKHYPASHPYLCATRHNWASRTPACQRAWPFLRSLQSLLGFRKRRRGS